jgi:hypothetical protein
LCWIEGFTDEVCSAVVGSVDDLDCLLDRLSARAVTLQVPFNVTLAVDSAAAMDIVVGADLAHVQWLRQEPWSCLGCVSGRPENETDVIEFAGHGQYSELPRHMWIEVPLARQAVRHYFRTGKLTPLVRWESV